MAFSGKKNERLEQLEGTQKELGRRYTDLAAQYGEVRKQLAALTDAVTKKTSDYESEAVESASQAADSADQARGTLSVAKALQASIEAIAKQAAEVQSKLDVQAAEAQSEMAEQVSEAQSKLGTIQEVYTTAQAAAADIASKQESLANTQKKIEESSVSATAQLATAQNDLQKTQEALTTAKQLHAELAALKETADTLEQDMTTAQVQASKRNAEIAQAHKEVFGFNFTDPDSREVLRIDGTKKELEQAFDAIKADVDGYSEVITGFQTEKEREYAEFIEQKHGTFEALEKQIRDLLPDAMTAGLSHAYEIRRDTEEEELGKAKSSFQWAIFFLVMTSCLPIAASFLFIHTGTSIPKLIQDMPRVVATILPLYIPLFWLAMSANKRVKLSKRLIEEYAHKETLSKTFEGLSSRIEDLGDSETVNDLRERLLYNMVSTSSENPGQLIKDFHRSDNPLFDALDKSISLSQSLEKLKAVPGASLLLQPWMAKQEKKIGREKEAAEAAVAEALRGRAAENEEEEQEEA